MVRAATIAAFVAMTGMAQAAPFSMQTEATGGAWVLNDETGALRFCRTVTTRGRRCSTSSPAVADPRPSLERPARPDCVVAVGPTAAPEPMPARGMLGDGSSGPQVGSARGMLGDGGFYGGGWPGQQVIIVRPGAVGMNLY